MFSFSYTEATANNAYLLALISSLLSLGTTEIFLFDGSYPRLLSFANVLFYYSLMSK